MLQRLSFPPGTKFSADDVEHFEALEHCVRGGIPEAAYVGTVMPPVVNGGRTMVMFEVWLDQDDVCCVHFVPSPDPNTHRIVVARGYDSPDLLTEFNVSDVADESFLRTLFSCIRALG